MIHTNFQTGIKTEPKNTTIDKEESNTGTPKLSNGHGCGGEIVVDSRMQAINKVNQSKTSNYSSSESTLMEAGAKRGLEKLFDQLKNGQIREYELIYNPTLLKAAYYHIKSIPGNMTPGADEETLDGFSNN